MEESTLVSLKTNTKFFPLSLENRGIGEGSLSAFQTSDGAPLWHYKTGGALLSSPTGANEVVYVGVNDGSVYALRASDGALLWQTFVSVAITAVSSISIHLKKS
jgi:outer membrane protein assembly factor BamB